MLSFIYALFSQTVFGFWGLRSQTPPGLYPWISLGDFCPQTPNLPTPGKKSCGRLCPSPLPPSPPSDVVCPVFFVNSATKKHKFHSGVMVSPPRLVTPLSKSLQKIKTKWSL